MRPALLEPLIDGLDAHFRDVSGLRGRQHLALKLAHGTMCSHKPSQDAFLLENCDLNSSFLYCCHLEVVVESGLSLPAASFERRETTLWPARKSGRKWEINRKTTQKSVG